MKNVILLLAVIVMSGCSSVKKTQVALNSGNYDGAIAIAIDKLRDNKTRKANQPYIIMLEQAFVKAADRDLNRIKFLRAGANPADFEEIYETYNRLTKRQDRIRPLLPLYLKDEGKTVNFKFRDYTNALISSKNELSTYLYSHAMELLQNGVNKFDFREAYDNLSYLSNINSGYKDVDQLMEEAYHKGVDFVRVIMENQSDKVIPKRLEEELLNFNTYGLNDLWTIYHNVPLEEIDYDYEMALAIRDINFSPDQVSEKIILKERKVQDGYTYVLDQNGNVKKDSLGNDIKIDKYITVRTKFQQYTQFKAVQVIGEVAFKDLINKQVLNSYPLASEFVFRHFYAQHQGDKRALEAGDLELLQARVVPFPTNEEMVYNAGEDIKNRLKNIIKKQQLSSLPN